MYNTGLKPRLLELIYSDVVYTFRGMLIILIYGPIRKIVTRYKKIRYSRNVTRQTEYSRVCVSGGGGGGGVNLGVILVRVCEPVFQNLPHSYTWPLKKRTHSYT